MAGTRFILKTGKMLGEKRTEIRLRYRPNSLCLSCADTMNAEPNQLVIEVYPSEGIRLTFSSKVPGYEYLSLPISEGMAVYKNLEEKRPAFEITRSFAVHGMHESTLHLPLHTGTHVDYPLHAPMQLLPLKDFGVDPGNIAEYF